MKDLIEKVVAFNKPASENDAEEIIKALGETPSLNTLDAVIKYYKEQEKNIRTKDLLDWMNENDQTSFETDDVKVSIRTNVNAKVIMPELAFKWLDDNQYGDLIKDTLDFPKGELTPEAENALEELGLSYVKKSGIHPQSLKKIIKDRLSSGEDMPEPYYEEDGEVDLGDGIKIGYFDECIVKEK